MYTLNDACCRYIDNLIVAQLKHSGGDIVRIDLEDLYEYFLDHGYFFVDYEYDKFQEDLCEQLDAADYTYLLEIRKYSSIILTIEMEY